MKIKPIVSLAEVRFIGKWKKAQDQTLWRWVWNPTTTHAWMKENRDRLHWITERKDATTRDRE